MADGSEGEVPVFDVDVCDWVAEEPLHNFPMFFSRNNLPNLWLKTASSDGKPIGLTVARRTFATLTAEMRAALPEHGELPWTGLEDFDAECHIAWLGNDGLDPAGHTAFRPQYEMLRAWQACSRMEQFGVHDRELNMIFRVDPWGNVVSPFALPGAATAKAYDHLFPYVRGGRTRDVPGSSTSNIIMLQAKANGFKKDKFEQLIRPARLRVGLTPDMVATAYGSINGFYGTPALQFLLGYCPTSRADIPGASSFVQNLDDCVRALLAMGERQRRREDAYRERKLRQARDKARERSRSSGRKRNAVKINPYTFATAGASADNIAAAPAQAIGAPVSAFELFCRSEWARIKTTLANDAPFVDIQTALVDEWAELPPDEQAEFHAAAAATRTAFAAAATSSGGDGTTIEANDVDDDGPAMRGITVVELREAIELAGGSWKSSHNKAKLAEALIDLLPKLKKSQLKSLAADHGIIATGKVAQLTERLVRFLEGYLVGEAGHATEADDAAHAAQVSGAPVAGVLEATFTSKQLKTGLAALGERTSGSKAARALRLAEAVDSEVFASLEALVAAPSPVAVVEVIGATCGVDVDAFKAKAEAAAAADGVESGPTKATSAELKAALAELGLSTSGRKSELAERLALEADQLSAPQLRAFCKAHAITAKDARSKAALVHSLVDYLAQFTQVDLEEARSQRSGSDEGRSSSVGGRVSCRLLKRALEKADASCSGRKSELAARLHVVAGAGRRMKVEDLTAVLESAGASVFPASARKADLVAQVQKLMMSYTDAETVARETALLEADDSGSQAGSSSSGDDDAPAPLAVSSETLATLLKAMGIPSSGSKAQRAGRLFAILPCSKGAAPTGAEVSWTKDQLRRACDALGAGTRKNAAARSLADVAKAALIGHTLPQTIDDEVARLVRRAGGDARASASDSAGSTVKDGLSHEACVEKLTAWGEDTRGSLDELRTRVAACSAQPPLAGKIIAKLLREMVAACELPAGDAR
ncbi:uncharacterized protein AMSG_03034 [Thecamonas trahens ATCC 50062]|uniref:SAP domain-containing protein n=1 Tax=Thecamonas trahens ATCC 50062 TaxID=461836 RepID=A0A0L0D2R4_THETB|nr:hypothetical protein AMSG_03034 [Thecamonas trahens ATCC 50062]KNC46597.1 hypothetical protein AMSG_03034 [Thecamonas trahens ATCC 50062]|eukprot:XP_013760372.1 hypothetical protein AMSG_03034 [Thecamonas trahens ATCC 50062]